MNLHRLYWLQCKYWRKWCALNTVSRIDLHSFEYNSPRWIRRISRKGKKYCMNISRHSLKLRTNESVRWKFIALSCVIFQWKVKTDLSYHCQCAMQLTSCLVKVFKFNCIYSSAQRERITRIIFLFVKIQQKSLRLNPSRALFYVVHL